MKFMIPILMAFSFQAFAQGGQGGAMGGHVGNGGNGVICYTDNTRSTISSIQMFDYWEQHTVLNYAGGIQLGASHLTVQEKIDIAVERIAKFDPLLAEKVNTVSKSIVNNISNFLVTAYQLPEINDANPRAIPNQPNCFIEQYAVQWKEPVNGQRRFAIADKFYSHSSTSNDDKAGIILHEALYRHGITNGATNSDGIRFFNYVIATNKLDSGNVHKYFQFIQDAKMNYKGCQYVSLDIGGGVILRPISRKERSLETICYSEKDVFLSPNIKIDLLAGLTIDSKKLVIRSNSNEKVKYSIRKPSEVFKTYLLRDIFFLEDRRIELFLYLDIVYDFKIKPTFSDFDIPCEENPQLFSGSFLEFDLNSESIISCTPDDEKFSYVLNGETYISEAYHLYKKPDGTTGILLPQAHSHRTVEFNVLFANSSRVYRLFRDAPSNQNPVVDENFTLLNPAMLNQYRTRTTIDLGNGIQCELISLELDENNKFQCQGKASVTMPSVKLSLESFSPQESSLLNASLDTYCREKNSNLKMLNYKTTETYVENEEVLDLKSGQMVKGTDKFYNLVTSIQCLGNFKIDP